MYANSDVDANSDVEACSCMSCHDGMLHPVQQNPASLAHVAACQSDALVRVTALVQVFIVGPDATIDTIPSSKWLEVKTADWTGWKTHLKINIKRDEALDIISMPGMLMVLCSGIDNLPYVVAEAAVCFRLYICLHM